ncbi:MAG: hypothetical protein WBE72_14700, partial [Terracidiphilus sp.]
MKRPALALIGGQARVAHACADFLAQREKSRTWTVLLVLFLMRGTRTMFCGSAKKFELGGVSRCAALLGLVAGMVWAQAAPVQAPAAQAPAAPSA